MRAGMANSFAWKISRRRQDLPDPRGGGQGIQGVPGPAGKDGEDGAVDTTKYYNKAHVDFLLATNTPPIGTHPG